MSRRIVIHRDMTFTYKGRAFEVHGSHASDPKNLGYGYEVIDRATGRTVRDQYDVLDDIRRDFPEHYEQAWADDDPHPDDEVLQDDVLCYCGHTRGYHGEAACGAETITVSGASVRFRACRCARFREQQA